MLLDDMTRRRMRKRPCGASRRAPLLPEANGRHECTKGEAARREARGLRQRRRWQCAVRSTWRRRMRAFVAVHWPRRRVTAKASANRVFRGTWHRARAGARRAHARPQAPTRACRCPPSSCDCELERAPVARSRPRTAKTAPQSLQPLPTEPFAAAATAAAANVPVVVLGWRSRRHGRRLRHLCLRQRCAGCRHPRSRRLFRLQFQFRLSLSLRLPPTPPTPPPPRPQPAPPSPAAPRLPRLPVSVRQRALRPRPEAPWQWPPPRRQRRPEACQRLRAGAPREPSRPPRARARGACALLTGSGGGV